MVPAVAAAEIASKVSKVRVQSQYVLIWQTALVSSPSVHPTSSGERVVEQGYEQIYHSATYPSLRYNRSITQSQQTYHSVRKPV